MTNNELKQEVLVLLHKTGDATARSIAEDLFIDEKPLKLRLNRALKELQIEGLIDASKTSQQSSPGLVNLYSIVPEGIEAIDETIDLEDPVSIELPKQALPDQDALKAGRAEREAQERTQEPLQNPSDPVITKYMLIMDGESKVFDDSHEAHSVAYSHCYLTGGTVEYYELNARLVGAFSPVKKVEFIGVHRLKEGSANVM